MFDWSDPNTFWLNVTDIVLGAVTLFCALLVGRAILHEVLGRLGSRIQARQDSHSMMMPELGLTMADGGEPIAHDPARNNHRQN
jgi:hypothetical protein